MDQAVTRTGDYALNGQLLNGRAQLDEAELVALTFAIVVIDGWNRLAVSFRAPAGSYQPRSAAAKNTAVA